MIRAGSQILKNLLEQNHVKGKRVHLPKMLLQIQKIYGPGILENISTYKKRPTPKYGLTSTFKECLTLLNEYELILQHRFNRVLDLLQQSFIAIFIKVADTSEQQVTNRFNSSEIKNSRI